MVDRYPFDKNKLSGLLLAVVTQNTMFFDCFESRFSVSTSKD